MFPIFPNTKLCSKYLIKKRKVTIKSLCLWGLRFWFTLKDLDVNDIKTTIKVRSRQDEIFCKKSGEYCVVFVFAFFIGTLSLLSIVVKVKLTNQPFSPPRIRRKEPKQSRQKSRGWPPVKVESAHGRTWCREYSLLSSLSPALGFSE